MDSIKKISLSKAFAAWREELGRPSFQIAAINAIMVTAAVTLVFMELMAHTPTLSICVATVLVLLPALSPWVDLFKKLDLLINKFFRAGIRSYMILLTRLTQATFDFLSITITPPKSPPRHSARKKAKNNFFFLLLMRARRAVILPI